jgi:hypothetical protein
MCRSNAPTMGRFYLSFIQLVKIFVTVLCLLVSICLSMTGMTKLDISSPSSTSYPASLSGYEPARRLIVLVPDLESDYIPAIHRIWELANAQHAQIQFLGLCQDTRQELNLRRVLATMSAMVQDGKVSTEAKVEIGRNWVDILKRNYQTGDMIVCFAEQRVGLLHRPLSQILEANLNFPVYILSGLDPQKTKSNWLSQVIVWSGAIGIIISFCILQVKIDQLPKDWFQNALLIFSIIPELWLIWVWNSLFR